MANGKYKSRNAGIRLFPHIDESPIAYLHRHHSGEMPPRRVVDPHIRTRQNHLPIGEPQIVLTKTVSPLTASHQVDQSRRIGLLGRQAAVEDVPVQLLQDVDNFELRYIS